MRWGPAVSALKKLWKSYKIAGRTGESRSDLAWKINQIQKAMGIEKSEFPELDGMEADDEESTDEEIELQRREKKVAEIGVLISGLAKKRLNIPMSGLGRINNYGEQREAEQENDDSWFS